MKRVSKYNSLSAPTLLDLNNDSKTRLKTGKAGFKFDPASDEWYLQHGFSTAKVAWIKGLSDTTLASELREGLSSAARKLSTARIIPACKDWEEFLTLSHEKVTKKNLVAYIAYVRSKYASDVKLSVISGTLKFLLPLNSSRYRPLVNHFKTVTFRNSHKGDFLNPETGALSSTEDGNIIEALRQHYLFLSQQLYNFDNSGLAYSSWSGYMALRLAHFSHRRFETLSQMKWMDIITCYTQREGLEITRIQARFPRAKTQNGGFRKQWEGYRIELDDRLAKELSVFKKITEQCIHHMLKDNEIDLSESEFNALLRYWPILTRPNAFSGCYPSMKPMKWSNQRELFTASRGPGLHMTNNTYQSQTRKVLKIIDVKSERVSNFKYGTRRQRHTLATSMAIEGHEDAVIAKALGVVDKSTVKAYKDMTTDAIDTIDQIMSPVLSPFINVAMSRIVLKSDEQDIKVTSNGIKEIGGCRHCENKCKNEELSAPFACYSCDLFRPIATADHMQVLNDAMQYYHRDVKRGARPFQLRGWSRVIRYIQATIAACSKFNKEQEQKGD